MSAPAFTPGPWFVSGKQTVRQDRRADMPVGACQPIAVMHWRDGPANACLIAAAPELYAQLEFAVKLLGGLPGFAGTAQIESMRAALAKAVQS